MDHTEQIPSDDNDDVHTAESYTTETRHVTVRFEATSATNTADTQDHIIPVTDTPRPSDSAPIQARSTTSSSETPESPTQSEQSLGFDTLYSAIARQDDDSIGHSVEGERGLLNERIQELGVQQGSMSVSTNPDINSADACSRQSASPTPSHESYSIQTRPSDAVDRFINSLMEATDRSYNVLNSSSRLRGADKLMMKSFMGQLVMTCLSMETDNSEAVTSSSLPITQQQPRVELVVPPLQGLQDPQSLQVFKQINAQEMGMIQILTIAANTDRDKCYIACRKKDGLLCIIVLDTDWSRDLRMNTITTGIKISNVNIGLCVSRNSGSNSDSIIIRIGEHEYDETMIIGHSGECVGRREWNANWKRDDNLCIAYNNNVNTVYVSESERDDNSGQRQSWLGQRDLLGREFDTNFYMPGKQITDLTIDHGKFLTITDAEKVNVYDLHDKRLLYVISCGPDGDNTAPFIPSCVTADAGGSRILVGEFSHQCVMIFTEDGQYIAAVTTNDCTLTPKKILATSDGSIVVLNHYPNNVLVFRNVMGVLRAS